MTTTCSFTIGMRHPRIGDGGGGPFAAVKTGGIIDWWITDKPPGLIVGI